MRRLSATLRVVPFLAALATSTACGGDGRLLILLERPEDSTLDPLRDDRLARFSLRVDQRGKLSDQETFRSDADELTVGDVPVGSPFDLRLAGKSSSGQMLGLGQVFDVNVDGDGTVVQVKFRKPIGYVAGQPGVDLVDASASTREKAALSPIRTISSVSAVATTPDGAWLLAVAGSSLVALRTSNHSIWAQASIPAGGTFVAVSPDNRYAVVCHREGKELSIVDMVKLAEKNPIAALRVPLGGKPTKAVFSGKDRSRVKVLVDGVGHLDGCSASSSLVDVLLATGQPTGTLKLNKPVADVVIDPRDDSLLMALPCEKSLGKVQNGMATKLDLGGQVPRTYDLATSDQHLVVLGSDNGTPPQGDAVLFDLSRTGFNTPQTKKFSLPQLGVSITSAASTGAINVSLALETFTIFDVTVAPDGQRTVCLFQARYVSNIGVGSCNYNFNIKAMGYLVVDLTVETYLFSQLTDLVFQQCSTCDYPSQSACESWFTKGMQSGKALTTPEFEPRGTALLFGGS